MVGIASGFALSGKVPLMAAFAPFLMRAWEQIRSTVARANLNVKIVGTHAGLAGADDGSTHQSLEDIALMRVLPNMTVIVPGDKREVAEATEALIEHTGPVYMRIGRDDELSFLEGDTVFKLGKAAVVKDGSDVTIFSNGLITSEALAAANRSKISVKVVHVPTVKPIDRDAVVKAAKETGAVICAEEHNIIGGLGGAVAEVLSKEYPVRITRLGINDTFGESGPYKSLLDKFGLTSRHIEAAIEESQRGKERC
jgi:transketolase